MTSHPTLLARGLRRALEVVDVATRYAADGPSRRRLLEAYGALARRRWRYEVVEARLRLGRSTVPLRFRDRDIYVIGEILHDQVYRLHSALPPHPVIVDAGANIGLSALWLADRYPGARFHCFEPEARCFTLLAENLRQLPHAMCEQAALSDRSGELRLYVTENASDHSVFDTGVPSSTEVVQAIRLDEYIRSHDIARIDLLKIDVEGSERAVLEGLGEEIERVGVIVGECHEGFVDQAAFYGLLRDRGFRLVARRPIHRFKQDHMFEAAR